MRLFSLIRSQLIYGLVFLSGACGLIYEIVWHRYLSILLGSQAQATATVLALFLGGIGVGYAVFGRWTASKRWNLVVAYGIVEIGIGLWGILFPTLFHVTQPAVAKLYMLLGLQNTAIDVVAGLILIGLPTFLMGGTLPLLTQGLSHTFATSSRTHARIYGYNTVGACAGSLGAGYLLIPTFGLIGTSVVAAILNIAVGIVSIFALGQLARSRPLPAQAEATPSVALTFQQKLLIAVAFLSGFYVLSLQTVFARLVALTSGSSSHNFTLVVSAFVLGLGLGSLLLNRMRKATFGHLALNQALASLALFFIYLTADNWGYYVHLIRVQFRTMPATYHTYHAALGLAFLVALLVPIGLCGMTLPLCFHLFRQKIETLGRNVGQLYGWNTLGCVMGAYVGGYLLLHVINIDVLFKVAVTLCLAAFGIASAGWLKERGTSPRRLALCGTYAGGLFFALWQAPLFDARAFVEPFRSQSPEEATFKGAAAFAHRLAQHFHIILHKDGPNTSVTILGLNGKNGEELARTLLVNGKSDGSTVADRQTFALTAHIPALFAKKIERTAVIGFGTGVTVGALALHPEVKSVDVTEIAGTLIEHAKEFDAYNNNVSKDPKIRFHHMDAFRYFYGINDRFDLILSEPSNPWVQGVEQLFSDEFYAMVKTKLGQGGVFGQWLQAYSFNNDLLQMIFRSMKPHFKHMSLFMLEDADLLLMASDEPLDAESIARARERFNKPVIKQDMVSLNFHSFEAILGLHLIPTKLARTLATGPANRLERPLLGFRAQRAFFEESEAGIDQLRRAHPLYFTASHRTLLPLALNGVRPDRKALLSLQQDYCQRAKWGSLTQPCLEATVGLAWDGDKEAFDRTEDIPPIVRAKLDALKALPKVAADGLFLKKNNQRLQFFKQTYSFLSGVPFETLLAPIDDCLTREDFPEELHGRCLMQRLRFLEETKLLPEETLKTAGRFLTWFSTLSPETPGYERFQRATRIATDIQRKGMQAAANATGKQS